MKVLVCGDRNWKDRKVILARLKELSADTIIIHGAAPGADTLAGDVARDLGLSVQSFPARWERYGPGAGPIRNREMLDENPVLVIAFHFNLDKSKGTADCVRGRRRWRPPEAAATRAGLSPRRAAWRST